MYILVSLLLLISAGANAQNNYYKICAPSASQALCQNLDKDDSRVTCEYVTSKIDCAFKLSRGQADIGVFTEEEVVLLAQQQPQLHRVVASVRHQNKPTVPYAFEAVAVVRSTHTGGVEGLRNGGYCHPGLDVPDLRWSPRVLKTLERQAARTNDCVQSDTNGRTYEELEVAALSRNFFAACRPGRWSNNDVVDARLKRDFPNLCTLCSGNGTSDCSAGYRYDMGIQIAQVSNTNRHIQALECLVRYNGTVAYVAWQHVQEYFLQRQSEQVPNYALLCEDGSLAQLTLDNLNLGISPCAWVRQPWAAILTNPSKASSLLVDIKTWWPDGGNPMNENWQSVIFSTFVGGTGMRVTFEDATPTILEYSSAARNIADIPATTVCMPTQRWCTISSQEQTKCEWIRRAAYTLGIEPTISCLQRADYFRCLDDIKESRADFIAIDSNYGYLGRQIYNLSPVMLLQNARSSLSRVAALVRANSDITRFENLRDKRACFPEFGGIAFVSFVVAAHNKSVLSQTECDYGRAVGELFSGACAPGAMSNSHQLYDSGFNASSLCTSCRSAISMTPTLNASCAPDWTNIYYGNNGSLSCLADQAGDVAFLETQTLSSYMTALNLQPTAYRVLCYNNNSLGEPGAVIPDECLMSLVIDSEVLARRNNQQFNSLSSLLSHLDTYFGYHVSRSIQLIELEMYSPFDGTNNLLFKDSVIGLTAPSANATLEAARNYFQLFQHLEGCSNSADLASRAGLFTLLSMVLFNVVCRWIL